NMRTGPDGNVYLIDWYDKQACHSGDIKAFDRANGRVYKICYRGTKPVKVDLQKCTDQQLIQYQTHKNDYFVRHARRILQERTRNAEELRKVWMALGDITFSGKDEARQLRHLWALHVVGIFNDPDDQEQLGVEMGLNGRSPHVRAWTIQLALES